MVSGAWKDREHRRFVSVQTRGCLSVTRRSDKQREQQMQLAGYLAMRECEVLGMNDTRLGGEYNPPLSSLLGSCEATKQSTPWGPWRGTPGLSAAVGCSQLVLVRPPWAMAMAFARAVATTTRANSPLPARDGLSEEGRATPASGRTCHF